MHELNKLFQDIETKFNNIKSETALFLILNIHGQSQLENDYEGHSMKIEFFSLHESQQFLEGITNLGLYHEVIHGEKQFIEKLHYIDNLPFKIKLVYSSTCPGPGRSKSALIPAICSLYNLLYCSNDIYTSALLENKVHLLNLLEFHNFPIPMYWIYNPELGWFKNRKPRKDIKLISKLAYGYASIGITKDSVSYFNNSYESYIKNLSLSYRQPVIVEEFIDGFEVEVPIFNLDIPICPATVGIKVENEMLGKSFLTYEMISNENYSFYNFDLFNNKIAEKIKKIAISSYEILNLGGIVRIDFRISENGNPYIMDYNNAPHLTKNHSCAFSLIDSGYTYENMLLLLLWTGLKNTSFESKFVNPKINKPT